ncbi:hypothetical protein [Streptomyces sp. NPDC001843]
MARTGDGYQSVIAVGQLADPGWATDPATCQILPAYLRNALP